MFDKGQILFSVILFLICFFRKLMAEGTITESTFDFTLPEGADSTGIKDHGSVVVCVVNTWAYWRPNEGFYNITKDVADIGHLCTHVVYRSLLIDKKGLHIYFNDLHLDEKLEYFSQVVAMKTKYPHLKIIPSLGGWTLNSGIWSDIANSSEKRGKFIKNSVEFLRENNCSGFNLDWEYPKLEERSLFTLLAKELQDVFQKEGFILTTTIWARLSQVETSYEISEITRIFDLVLVKFVDLHPEHRLRTGYNSPLYSHSPNNAFNILQHLIKEKGNPEKIIFGLPFYGRPYLLNNISSLEQNQNAGWNESATGGKYPAPWSRDGDFTWGYNEICSNFSKEKSLPWKMFWDDYSKVPLNTNREGRWMSFDNIRSIYAKVVLARQFGLKGVMAWTIDMDDFRGDCGHVTYPLLRTINYALVMMDSKRTSGSSLCKYVQSQKDIGLFKPYVTTNVYNWSIPQNSAVHVQCTVQGNPPSKIHWTKDKISWTTPVKIVPQSNNCPPYDELQVTSLKINSFGKGDAGIYFCEAENKFGRTSRQFTLLQYSDEADQIPNKSNNKAGGSPWTLIAVGIVIFLLCIGFLLGFLAYKRIINIVKTGMSTDEIKEFHEGSRDKASLNDYEGLTPENLPYDNSYELPFQQYHIDKENILGSGAFGVVYKGRVNDLEVAVKSTKPGTDKQYLKSLLSELKILIYLGQHANVVNLVGASTPHLKQGMVYMFVELCPLGNLLDYLRKCRNTFIHTDKNAKPKLFSTRSLSLKRKKSESEKESLLSVTTTTLYMWALQIAKAIQHLHAKKVIHGDLAARNVLVFERNIVKITDFGLSRKLYEYSNYVKKNQEPLPWRWMAIESLRDLTFSFKSDIWAYGITTWEIFSLGETPYPGLTWTTTFVDSLSNDMRVHKPKYSSDSMYDVMLQCWQENPDDRPDTDYLIQTISTIIKDFTNSGEYVDPT